MNSSPPFVRKTFQLVSDNTTNHIVSWSEDGTSFTIWNTHAFQKDILPQYFKHNNLCSFVRQLNTYGFHKINASEGEGLEFSHPSFICNQEHMLSQIRRRKPKKVKTNETKQVVSVLPTFKSDEPVSDRQVAEAILALAKRQQESELMLQSVCQELQEAKSMIDTLHNYDAPSPLSRKRSFDEYSSSSDSSPEYSPLAFSPEPKKMKTEFTYDNNLFNSDFPLSLPNDNNCFYDMMGDQPVTTSCAQTFGSFPSQFDLNELLLDL